MHLVISPCTNRKARTARAFANALPPGNIDSVGDAWLDALALDDTLPAGQLYLGRTHRASSEAARLTDAVHFIASAGFGLLPADTPVPGYSASVVEGEDNILARMTDGTDAAAWWAWLQARSPFAVSIDNIAPKDKGLILVALPQAYLAMLAAELLALPDTVRCRVRLFTAAAVPGPLGEYRMPYDARLDGPDSDCPGTRSDFAARALLHFVSQVLPDTANGCAQTHAEAVMHALADWRLPHMRVGERRDDDELRLIIDHHWDAQQGRVGKLLRVLRDDLGIACEQRRFARLARTIRIERAAAQ